MKSVVGNARSQGPSRAWVGLAVALAAGAFRSAVAADMPPTAIEELARRADDVVHGQVASVETKCTASGRLVTRVELEVAEVWKGPLTNRFALVLGSGVLGERWVRVVGEPGYRPGEEIVVFTVRNPAGEAVTLDFAQGKFSVSTEATTRVRHVSNGVFGGSSGGTGPRMPQQLPLSLDVLHERVREALVNRKEAS